MKRLIINADDFGLCEGANLGILRAHRHGIVTSATVMMNMPGAGDALSLVPPSLGVGVHLTLTGGRPLCANVPTLVDEAGNFLKLPVLRISAAAPELEAELRAQVDAFCASGLRPTHLDSHHHVHLELPAVGDIVRRLAAELGVPVRGVGDAVRFTGRFYGQEQVSPAALLSIVDDVADGETVEVMCHPAYLDPALLFGSRYALPRVHELATLTDPGLRAALSARHVQLISYRDL
ncbi:MAG TPA: chitin disaccharide deacetylase [Symbiobacteriaceae bacterium]|nr:chitin disaccharide deacetylase [Symbiobacteriaceae bacterium]